MARPLERVEGRVEGFERRDRAEIAPVDGPAGQVFSEGDGEGLDLGELGHLSIVARRRP